MPWPSSVEDFIIGNADLSIRIATFIIVTLNFGGDLWLNRNTLQKLSVSPGEVSKSKAMKNHSEM